MLLYTTHITPRLSYMAHWLGIRLFNEPLKIITNNSDLPAAEWMLNYTSQALENPNSFWIQPHPLLFETGITQQAIDVKHKDGLSYFFETGGDYHFDILAASFYLMQRYEEYLPHEKDMYGRYAHENSLAFKQHFLHLPLVDLWVNDLVKVFGAKENQPLTGGTNRQQETGNRLLASTFLPTYDIDIAYSYKGKGLIRNIAGIIRSFGQWNVLKERCNVLWGKQQDPFDVFAELDALHQQYHLQPVYFFLLANKRLGYDKNLHPATPEMKMLIQSIAEEYATGIHPSWQSGDDESLLKTETGALKEIGKKDVSISRQHYIRMQLPLTYEVLINHSINADYSMGYGSINGFRASTSVPYNWYHLQKEQSTGFTIFPFCYMEANSIFEQKNTPAQALKELQQYHDVVKKVGGTLITIFHNHLIGLDANGRKWMGMYKEFLEWRK